MVEKPTIGAPNPSIEVTPEMIRAGVSLFEEWDPEREDVELFVGVLFLRMAKLSILQQQPFLGAKRRGTR